MKHISIKIILSLIALQCLGCGKESELIKADTVSPKIYGKLKTLSNKTTKTSLAFVYDPTTAMLSRLSLTATDSTTTESFTRNEAGQPTASVVEVNTKGKKYNINREYTYTGNRLSSIKETIADAKDYITDSFFYTESGQIRQTARYLVRNGNQTLQGNAVYEWGNENIVTFKDRTKIGRIEEEALTYDDKENPLTATLQLAKIPGRTIAELSKNNLRAMVRLFEGTKFKYEHQFDADGRLMQTTISGFENGQWKITEEWLYEYWK